MMEATFIMHSLFIEATEKVVRDPRLLDLFNIPTNLWKGINYSWENRQMDLLGRFDWSWNGEDEPKLLEYNADTPSLLLESGAAQYDWMISKYPGLKKGPYNIHQANYIEAALAHHLVLVSKKCKGRLGLITVDYDDESFVQMNYLK